MAAQSRSFFGEVKKELECCVCQEQFDETKEPKILKCLHTFCKSCLELWLRQHGGGQLSCPTCRQITECPNNSINSLPSNLFYQQMVEIVEAYGGKGQEDSPQCGSCDERKPLKFYCSHCNCFLCEDCSMAHRKLKIFKGHNVKEIGNFMSSDAQDYARKLNVCKEHGDEVRFYCEQCVTCICRDCAVLEHRDHDFVSIDKGMERKRSEIETKMENVSENAFRLRNEKEFLEAQRIRMNKSIEKAKEEVHRVAECNIALIRQHESSVTEQLIKQKDVFWAEFSNAVFQIDEKVAEIENSLKFCNDILRRNNLPEILNVEKVLEQRIQELSKPSDVNMKPNYSEVKYVPNDSISLKESTGKLLTTRTVPSLSEAEGNGLTQGFQGEDCAFTVITKDSHGKRTYSEIDEVIVDIKSLQTGAALIKVNIKDSQEGCYNVTYKPETTGEFNMSITIAGEAIRGSPFHLKVDEEGIRVDKNFTYESVQGEKEMANYCITEEVVVKGNEEEIREAMVEMSFPKMKEIHTSKDQDVKIKPYDCYPQQVEIRPCDWYPQQVGLKGSKEDIKRPREEKYVSKKEEINASKDQDVEIKPYDCYPQQVENRPCGWYPQQVGLKGSKEDIRDQGKKSMSPRRRRLMRLKEVERIALIERELMEKMEQTM